MKRWLFRFVYALRTDNNTRLKTAWVVTGAWLFLNLFVFGFGEQTHQPSTGDTAERYYNWYYHRQFVTDAEMHPGSEASRAMIAVMRSVSWWGWVLMFLGSIAYIPFAFSDEVGRAWQSATRKAFEKSGGIDLSDLPPTVTSPPPGGGKSEPQTGGKGAFPLLKYLSFELGLDMVREFITRAIRRRT